MRIDLVEKEYANHAVKSIYSRFEDSGFGVYNVMKLWANDPAFLAAFESMLNALYADDTLEPRYRELAWLRTSQINSCHY